MEKQTDNDQTIRQYLLGSLPDEETERLDELSFIDGEFSERLDAVETDLVDAFVKGELSGQTLSKFDSHYLASPRRREKVGFAQALQTVAERAAATGEVVFEPEPAPAAAVSDKLVSSWKSLLGFLTLPRIAVAAAAILALIGGWSAFELSRLRTQVDQAQARHNALEQGEVELRKHLERQRSASSAMEEELRLVREEKDRLALQIANEKQIAKLQLPALALSFTLPAPNRAIGQAATISIPPGTADVFLRLELAPDDYPSYRTVLLTEADRKPAGWKRERLKSRARGENRVIEIKIPARLLKSRDYILEVAGISGGGVVEEEGKRGYSFKVVKQ